MVQLSDTVRSVTLSEVNMNFAQKVVVALVILAGLGLIASGVTLIWMVLVDQSTLEVAVEVGLFVLVFIPMWMLYRAYLSPTVDPAIREGAAAFPKRLGIVSDGQVGL
jgi:hypothetical protein